jgi:hypothetical protein
MAREIASVAPLGIMRHTRYGGRACIDGRWECCQVLRWP